VRNAVSNALKARTQLGLGAVSRFFVNTQDGRVAARSQLVDADLTDDDGKPLAPWHPVQGPGEESTLWYAVMRKRERGVFIGTLCIRHSERQASLEAAGWVEAPVEQIGVDGQPM
jgi:hypothetical protein